MPFTALPMTRGDVGLDHLEHRREQGVLAGEVMVERAPADARLAQHGLDRGTVVAVPREETLGDGEELAPRRLALLDLPVGPSSRMVLDIPTVGLYQSYRPTVGMSLPF